VAALHLRNGRKAFAGLEDGASRRDPRVSLCSRRSAPFGQESANGRLDQRWIFVELTHFETAVATAHSWTRAPYPGFSSTTRPAKKTGIVRTGTMACGLMAASALTPRSGATHGGPCACPLGEKMMIQSPSSRRCCPAIRWTERPPRKPGLAIDGQWRDLAEREPTTWNPAARA